MKYYKILFSLVLILLFTACTKECMEMDDPTPVMGCIDVTAENFNTDADTDDGSCTYFVDPLLGNFIATDSCFYNPFDTQLDTAVFQYGFVIGRLSANEVYFAGITQCEDTITASVSPSFGLVIPAGASDCLGNLIGQWSESGSTLTYSFPTQFGECRGVAVQQ